MYNENVKRAIQLQTEVNCELLIEWYNKQSKSKDDEYIQMEIDFLLEQEGQEAILSQWDMA